MTTSTRKANPAELAIINLTQAEKRLSILPILLEEASYEEIVTETVSIVESAISALIAHAGVLPDPELDLIEQFHAADGAGALAPVVSRNLEKIVEIHEEVVDWHGYEELPDRETAEELIDWTQRLTKLAQRVVKDLDE